MRVAAWVIFIVIAAAPLHAQDFLPPLEGELLAYTDAAGDAVYLYDTATTHTRALTLGAGVHHVWDFSPDGCHVLATLTDGDQPTRLVSAALDGADVRELVDTGALPAAAWSVWAPDWSPTQDRIALTLARPVEQGRESRVAWIPGDGGAPTFYSVAGDEHSPVWSPDGVWLAYVSYEQRPAGATITATAEPTPAANAPLLREADIWMVSADGLTKERITRFDVGSAARAAWNPAGDLLGFVYSPSPGENQFWLIAAAPDAIPTQLSYTWQQTLDLTWHPDGEAMIAAVRGLQDESRARLWRVPLVGNADEDATPYLDETGVDFPRFNSDGTRLALRHNYELVIVSPGAGDELRLGSFGNTPPVWSPAGFAGEAGCVG